MTAHSSAAAYVAGYTDARIGLCLPDFYACQCDECREAYDQGQHDAILDMAGRR
jgi:hypothetical protein